jgi:hypothetical protein
MYLLANPISQSSLDSCHQREVERLQHTQRNVLGDRSFLMFQSLISFFIHGQYGPFSSWDPYSSHTLWCPLAPWVPLFPFQPYFVILCLLVFSSVSWNLTGMWGRPCILASVYFTESSFSVLSSASTWCLSFFVLSWPIYYCFPKIGASCI